MTYMKKKKNVKKKNSKIRERKSSVLILDQKYDFHSVLDQTGVLEKTWAFSLSQQEDFFHHPRGYMSCRLSRNNVFL